MVSLELYLQWKLEILRFSTTGWMKGKLRPLADLEIKSKAKLRLPPCFESFHCSFAS
jgi:hypothetical protein